MKEVTYRRIVTALFLIVIGKVLLLHNLNLLPVPLPEYVFTWKAFLIVLGGYVLIAHQSLSGILLVLAGAYFIIPEIPELSKYNIHAFWPALLIFLGIGIFIKSIFKPQKKKLTMNTFTSNTSNGWFNSSVLFGAEKKKFSAYEFQGAKITAICGGLELDLTDCYLTKDKPNVIDVQVICGGVELKVSKEWNIRTEINPIMGGVEDHINDMYDAYVDPAAELILTGSVIMGGIEIKRV